MLLGLKDAGKRFFVARRFLFHDSNHILAIKLLVLVVKLPVLVLRSTPGSSFETRFFIPDQIQVVDLEKFKRNISWNQSHPTLFEKLVCPVSWVWILKLSMQQTDQNTAQGMDFLQKLTFDFSWFATRFFIRDQILHSRPDSSAWLDHNKSMILDT